MIHRILTITAAMLLTMPMAMLAQEEGDNISREIFIYAPNDRAGLHAAYLDFEGKWLEIGQLCASDYGTWGAEKRMFHPNFGQSVRRHMACGMATQ